MTLIWGYSPQGNYLVLPQLDFRNEWYVKVITKNRLREIIVMGRPKTIFC